MAPQGLVLGGFGKPLGRLRRKRSPRKGLGKRTKRREEKRRKRSPKGAWNQFGGGGDHSWPTARAIMAMTTTKTWTATATTTTKTRTPPPTTTTPPTTTIEHADDFSLLPSRVPGQESFGRLIDDPHLINIAINNRGKAE